MSGECSNNNKDKVGTQQTLLGHHCLPPVAKWGLQHGLQVRLHTL